MDSEFALEILDYFDRKYCGEMTEVERTIRIVTHQKVLEGVPLPAEGFPVRGWSIEIHLLDSKGNQITANIFDKVVYTLHPTFANPTRTFKKPPFKIEEKGWGEFELGITLYFLEKSGDIILGHDLNFHSEKYNQDHKIKIPINKSTNLRNILSESGNVPNVDDIINSNNKRTKPSESTTSNNNNNNTSNNTSKNKKSKISSSAIKGNVDIEKLASDLTKLSEDDLLGVVQMVTDNRTPDMNIKNDVEEGEFTMDLYTLPDSLLKSLWEYVKKRVD